MIPDEDRDAHGMIVSLVELAVEAGDGKSVASLEANLKADPSDVPSRYSLGIKLAVSGGFEDGLDHLLEVVMRDRSYREDGAVKAMVKIFEILGRDTEVATRWRKRLGAAMY
jgi:putative thioredoxin